MTTIDTLKPDLEAATSQRAVLQPEKIVFILEHGFTAPATLYSQDLRDLVISGMGYAEWPSHQKAPVYAKDENIKWKFVK